MSEYQFADKGGEIVSVEYDKSSYLSSAQVLASLDSAFNKFPFPAYIDRISSEYEDVFHVTFPEGNDGIGDVFICAKGTTPGGRSGLKDEQRIQPKARYLNYVYDRGEEGKKAVFLGVYNRDGETIFCTWKVIASVAASIETPISKQIKITSIAKAMREGFVQQEKGKGEYACAFRPEFLYFYLRNCDWLHTCHVSELAEHTLPENFGVSEDVIEDDSHQEDDGDNAVLIPDESSRKQTGCNVLLYGVPGSGKSWTIEHEYCKPGTKVERLVFHPDYTYSDFIGQILPAVDEGGQVSYKFTPGPFTNILRDAYMHPADEYMLIIEEINRGNAPAIFGEVFQLLDRKVEVRDIGDDGFPIGTSEYGITNMNIAREMYGEARKNTKVRIPSNLSIIGTMNTSDQNVFTLDTAFQRRWDMRLIENNFDNVDPKLANAVILDTTITWRSFCTEINRIVVGNGARMSSAEDKRLGAYFVHLKDLQFNDGMGDLSDGEYDALRKKETAGDISADEKARLAQIRNAMKQNRRFPEKVIKYLWDDAFRFNREVIFETTEYQSLEQVIHAFMYASKLDRFKMFKENVKSAFVDSKQ